MGACDAKLCAMTENAEIDREIRRLAWPAIAEMLLHMFVWIVDTAMVGRLGARALSAVGLGASVYWTSVWIFSALAIGTSVMVARAVGANDARRAAFVAGQGLLVGAALGALVAIGAFAAAPSVYRLARFRPEVSVLGIQYMRIVSVGALPFLLTQVGSGILRGSGDTRTPLHITMVANVINAVGDYVLIFGALGFPKLGTEGAAIATFAAHAVAGILMMAALFRKGNRVRLHVSHLLRVETPVVRVLLKLSVPAAVEEASINGSRTISSFMIATLGTVAFAANQVTVAAESLSFMPGYGFAVVSGILVGQSLGAGRPDRAVRVGRRSMWHAATVMGSVAAVFLLLPQVIVRAFTNDVEVVRIASTCLRIAAFEQVSIGVTDTLCGSLRGAGDTRTALRITAAGTWLVRMPLVVLAIYVLRLSLAAVWVITCLDWATRAALAARHFRAGKWREVTLQ